VQLDGCQERPSSVVLLGAREANQGHETSLCEVLYRAGIALDVVQGQVEKPVSQVVHGRGAQGLVPRCGTGKISIEDRDLPGRRIELKLVPVAPGWEKAEGGLCLLCAVPDGDRQGIRVTRHHAGGKGREVLSNGRDKAVAVPIQRLDKLWPATAATEGSAYLCDTTSQGTITDELLWPQLLEELSLWHDAVAMLDKVGQDVKHERFKPDEATGTA